MSERRRGTIEPGWFESLYAQDPDPWGFESAWYEHRKYALTVAALPRPRYRRCLEPGCSVGVLTQRLAERCDEIVALEPVAAAAARARSRLEACSGVEVREGTVPDAWPDGTFDLIVLSEVAYYLDLDALDVVLDRIEASLEPDGHLVAVHWRGETDYPLTAAEVHTRIGRRAGLGRGGGYAEEAFVLDWYERRR